MYEYTMYNVYNFANQKSCASFKLFKQRYRNIFRRIWFGALEKIDSRCAASVWLCFPHSVRLSSILPSRIQISIDIAHFSVEQV